MLPEPEQASEELRAFIKRYNNFLEKYDQDQDQATIMKIMSLTAAVGLYNSVSKVLIANYRILETTMENDLREECEALNQKVGEINSQEGKEVVKVRAIFREERQQVHQEAREGEQRHPSSQPDLTSDPTAPSGPQYRALQFGQGGAVMAGVFVTFGSMAGWLKTAQKITQGAKELKKLQAAHEVATAATAATNVQQIAAQIKKVEDALRFWKTRQILSQGVAAVSGVTTTTYVMWKYGISPPPQDSASLTNDA